MWGGRTHNFGLWLMVGGWQLTEWCCCSDTPGCGEDQTAGPEDALLQRYLRGDWHPQAVLGWGWQQWGRRVPCAPLSQFRAGWKLGVLQGTAPSSSPRCWCLCCVTTPHLLANPPRPGLCVTPCWVQGHRTAVPRGWHIPSAIAQPVPVVFQRGWCDRCPRAHSMPHVSTWGLKIPLAPACFSAGVICRDILDPSLSLAWSH